VSEIGVGHEDVDGKKGVGSNKEKPPEQAEANSPVSPHHGAKCLPKENSWRQRPPIPHMHTPQRIQSFPTLMRHMGFGRKGLKVDAYGRVKVKHPLGQLLIDAARLFEGIGNYRDKKLLQKYLHKEPYFHPRRTLDQAYYWTLNTTKARDRDQVVYRGTIALSDQYHTYDQEKCVWPAHADFGINEEHGCETCRANIRKISRVVMVEQLWMWILDEQTLITCFPKRYGANKHDLSGVHKSIRLRLQNARDNDIRSVYDLALIVLDECSNIFFDKVKTSDKQPPVIQLFSEAIANVVGRERS
jgi:hypothetical protein